MARRNGGSRQKDFRSLQSDLLKSRTIYRDPDFCPENRSLYFSGRIPPFVGKIEWKRPKELYQNPQFIVEGARHHDLDQGLIGNCWFIAGAATLATGPVKLFERVVPPDQQFQNNYAGVFRFNFWWYGKWTEVIIDDLLPTDGSRLIYCSNRERPNEFWPALLEKAYAKLRGCYEALDGGKMQDAMVDLTGGISEVINIQDKTKVPPNLYNLLQNSHNMQSMLGACIFRPDGATESEVEMANGLFMGHAYSITGFYQFKNNNTLTKLIRLRNPWGSGEWKGAWSDRSQEMIYLSESVKHDLKLEIKEDGEFWISYEDFIRNFDEIELCHLQVDALLEELADNDRKQTWNVTVFHDRWIRGDTAGGCGNPPNEKLYWNNPQFFVELNKPDTVLNRSGNCTLIVSLMEKEMNNQSKIAIGFDIYKLKNADYRPLNETRAPSNALLLARRSGKYVYYREVTKRFELPPGIYVIVTSTYNAGEEALFMLRIFTEKYVPSGVMEEKGDPLPLVLQPKDLVSVAFVKAAGNDEQLDATELQQFLEAISLEDLGQKLTFSVEQCRSLIPGMDNTRSGRLDFNATSQLWKGMKAYRAVFQQFDIDKSNYVDLSELTSMFNKLGFPVSKSVLASIMRRYGDRENRISLEDFIVVVFRLTHLFEVFMLKERSGNKAGIAEFTRNEFLEHTIYL